jgi:hypothetical protein
LNGDYEIGLSVVKHPTLAAYIAHGDEQGTILKQLGLVEVLTDFPVCVSIMSSFFGTAFGAQDCAPLAAEKLGFC